MISLSYSKNLHLTATDEALLVDGMVSPTRTAKTYQ